MATQLSAEQILGVTHSLKAHVYGPVPSHLAPEDRALVIERELEDLIEVATTYADDIDAASQMEQERDDMEAERDAAREALKELCETVRRFALTEPRLMKIGDLVVGLSADETQLRALRDAVDAAETEL